LHCCRKIFSKSFGIYKKVTIFAAAFERSASLEGVGDTVIFFAGDG
jgi:hypothetical protein